MHPAGRRLLAGAVPALGALAIGAWRRGTAAGRAVAALCATTLTLAAWFFRHPGCETPEVEYGVVAPASGRVVYVGMEDEPEVLGDQRLRLSIFLSLFDAHLTRAPVSGRVVYQRYHPGRHLVALRPKASSLNERNSIVLERADGSRVLLRQIAGLLARRIRSYVDPGQVVCTGEEVGFITFGSRVDVFLPAASDILVHPGQTVRAGETLLACVPLADAP